MDALKTSDELVPIKNLILKPSIVTGKKLVLLSKMSTLIA